MAKNELDLKPGNHWGRPERYNRSHPRKFAEGYDKIAWKHRKPAKKKGKDDASG